MIFGPRKSIRYMSIAFAICNHVAVGVVTIRYNFWVFLRISSVGFDVKVEEKYCNDGSEALDEGNVFPGIWTLHKQELRVVNGHYKELGLKGKYLHFISKTSIIQITFYYNLFKSHTHI